MKKLQAMKAKKGFTLVELIVVIVIIAILAAILIPILVNHVRRSRCTAELADSKSAHNVAASYVADRLTEGKQPTVIAADAGLAAEVKKAVDKATIALSSSSGGTVSNDEDIIIKATVGNHFYESGTEGSCGWDKCPAKLAAEPSS